MFTWHIPCKRVEEAMQYELSVSERKIKIFKYRALK